MHNVLAVRALGRVGLEPGVHGHATFYETIESMCAFVVRQHSFGVCRRDATATTGFRGGLPAGQLGTDDGSQSKEPRGELGL